MNSLEDIVMLMSSRIFNSHVMCRKMRALLALFLGQVVLAVTGEVPHREAAAAGVRNLTEDALRFLNSISNGLGFYSGLPYVTSLTTENFDETVLRTPNSWVIEFYQSWCGYCLRYSTPFKRFAKDLQRWQPVVKIAAVDCNFNSALCRRFGVMHVPSVKYLPYKFDGNFSGVVALDQRIGDEARKSAAQLRKDIVTALMTRDDLPMLKPYTGSLAELWHSLPDGHDWVSAVTSCGNAPTLGQELLLDYWHTKSVTVVPVACTGSRLIADIRLPKTNFSSIYALDRYKILANDKLLNNGPVDRAGALRAMRFHFTTFGLSVPKPFNPKSIPDMKITKEQLIKYAETHSNGTIPFPHAGIVYQVDIEAAVDRSIRNEVSQAQEIKGESFRALVQYLKVLKKYFPTVNNGKRLFKCLYKEIARNRTTTGLQVLHAYEQCISKHKPVYKDPNNGYLGCRGTLAMFRGFPCSMWMMFHTLQGQAHKKNGPDPEAVLKVMVGYVKHFFACEDCAQHFLGVAKTMPDRFKDSGEAVLWLWKAHNMANERLHGDETEDPKYPKVQFPSRNECVKCHNPDGTFNEAEVLKFLNKMYTNIDQHVWTDFKPHHANTSQVHFKFNNNL